MTTRTLACVLTILLAYTIYYLTQPRQSATPTPDQPTMANFIPQSLLATAAVRQAAYVSRSVFPQTQKGTAAKTDSSPVTVADYAIQAIIISHLHTAYPSDRIVGEEDADALRSDSELTAQVWHWVRKSQEESQCAVRSKIGSSSEMLDLLDLGRDEGGRTGNVWALDPIDGTKGFLRGGQYAICLALIVDGVVQVGVLGCPNLPLEDETLTASAGMDQSGDGPGALFLAIRGMGAIQDELTEVKREATSRPIRVSSIQSTKDASFCESLEAGHSSQDQQAEVAKMLGITKPSIRMDSQAKYASVARGAADVYIRLPSNPAYEEKIWDHAAGAIMIEEAGGKVTTFHGEPPDFGKGRTLGAGQGVVAAPASIHAEVLVAVQKVLRIGK